MSKRRQSYSEQLRDPRWQRKRLKVLERDLWRCTKCGDTKTELHVDHKAYRGRLKAWEYRMDELQTLCKPCHKKKHSPPQIEIQIPKTESKPLSVEEKTRRFKAILDMLEKL